MSPQQLKTAALGHSVYHMCKTLGKIAAECESLDHGGVFDQNAMRTAAVKMIVNALKLAADLDMNADEIAAFIRNPSA